MTRRADIVNALRENPTAFADRLGFPLLTDLHRDWCIRIDRDGATVEPVFVGESK